MTEPELRVVNSAAELLDVGVSIDNIQFLQLHAEAAEGDGVPTEMQEPEPAWGLKLRHDGAELGFRLSVTLDLGIGNIRIDAAINYVADEPVAMIEATRLEFANKVAVMALLPYIRQAAADLSQRVFGEVIMMPVTRQGDLKFGPDSEDAVDE